MVQTKITEQLESSIEDKIQNFSSLPYTKSPYNRRDWGHKWHSLCSYPSKLKPAIAYFLVNYFSKQDDIILDPFSGIGTIPFEACIQGRKGIGIDLNPLAFHATMTKTSPPSKEEVRKEFRNLINKIQTEKISTDNVPKEIAEFFHPQTLTEIVIARDYLLQEVEEASRSSISFLITNIAHLLHGNRPYALSRRSHNIIPIPPKGEFRYKSLITHTHERIERYMKAEFSKEFKTGRALNSSIFDAVINKEEIDVIITSPPFFGNTDFLRQNRVRIWFCGWDYQKQIEMKNKFVDRMDLSIYDELFKKFYDILKQNSLCILHVGVVKEKDMGLLISQHAEKYGFEKIGLIYEDTSKLESHGRTARGGTHKHQFLFLKKY